MPIIYNKNYKQYTMEEFMSYLDRLSYHYNIQLDGHILKMNKTKYRFIIINLKTLSLKCIDEELKGKAMTYEEISVIRTLMNRARGNF